tara:strand:+ start:4013 stop:8896 length:4884 start_codon:yes stop_codon:yes gene_type:complete
MSTLPIKRKNLEDNDTDKELEELDISNNIYQDYAMSEEFLKHIASAPNPLSLTDKVLAKNLFLLNPEAEKKYRKFKAGLSVNAFNSAIDIGRSVVDLVTPERGDEKRQKRRQKQEDYFHEWLTHLHGADIVEREKRYGLNSTKIEEMDSTAGQITQMIVGFVGGFKGIDKLLKLGKLKKGKEAGKFFQRNPYTRNIVAGEAATQLMFDPTEGTLVPELIGSVLPDNDGMLGDIKNYLEMEADDPDRNRVTDRMLLLADGLVFIGGFALLGKGTKSAYSASKPAIVKGINSTKEAFRPAFIKFLDSIKNSSKEVRENFIDKIKKSQTKNSNRIKSAQENRKFEQSFVGPRLNEPQVKGQGDIEAFAPSKYSLYNISAQFAENPLIRRLERYRRKMFTSRGLRTNKLFERFLKTENLKEMHQDRIANIAFNLESTIDDIVKKSGQSADNIKKQINKVLFTDFRSPTILTSGKLSLGRTQAGQFKKELNKLPEALREPVKRAREYQDKLSKLMIDTNYISPEMKKIFADNMGSYVRRSYKAFEDANFKPSNDVKKRAEEYIKTQIKKNNPGITPAKLADQTDAVMKNFEDIGKGSNFSANLESFDRIRKEILKNKKEIDPRIRALLGEIDDPIESIIHSTTKLSKLLEDAKFYDGAFQDGIGIYVRREQEGIFREVIPEGFGPLSGKYTSKEMLSYFNGYKGIGNDLVNNKLIGGVYTNLMYLKGFSQAAKTIYSHTTHVKNVAGGVQMSLANGINVFDAKQTREIVKILRARTKNNKDRQEFHELLSELGLLNKGVVARDLQGLAGDLASRKKGFVVGKLDWAADKIGLKKLANKAQNLYIAEDDFFKINMFLREEQNLKKVNELLPKPLRKTEQEIQKEAAKIVRSVLPNYDLVPEFFKAVRSVPFMGRFFSFMSESVRISYGTIMQSRREFQEYARLIKLGHKEAANAYLKRGGVRLGAFTAMAGTGAAAVEKTSQAISGLSDAETEAYKDFLPDYMRNSKIAIAVGKDGTPMIGNLSSWDAYDYPKKVVKLIGKEFFNQEVDNEAFSTALLDNLFREAVSPFLGESMIAEPLSDFFLSNGKTKTGGNMSYNFMGNKYEYIDYGDPTTNKLGNLNVLFGKLMTETLLPGTVDRFFDYTKTFGKDQTKYDQDIYKLDQFFKFTTGWGMSPMNKEYLENIHGFKTNDFKQMKSQHKNNINNGVGEVLEYDKFIDNYINTNMLHYKNFAKYTKFNESADLLGLNATNLMLDKGISKQDVVYVLKGKFNPLRISENMMLEMLEKDDNNEFSPIISDIFRIDRAFTQLPVMYDEGHYKVFKEDLETMEKETEEIKENREEKRNKKKTGGKVLNVEEDPIDRTNPFTGNTYSQDAERLGFFAGGGTSFINEAFKKAIQQSIGTTGINPIKPIEVTKQYKDYMGKYNYNPKVNFDEGGPVDSFGTTINDLLKNYKTQPEAQYKQKDGKFIRDKNGELIYAGYDLEVNKNPDDFVKDMYLILKESNHPFPAMAAAQAGVESRYGMSDLSRNHNNTFGVKVREGEDFKGVIMPTKEDYGKGLVDEVANFRSYNSIKENVDGYVNFLSSPRYKKALEAETDLEFLQKIKDAGYATDQEYVKTVSAVFNRNLEKGTYD